MYVRMYKLMSIIYRIRMRYTIKTGQVNNILYHVSFENCMNYTNLKYFSETFHKLFKINEIFYVKKCMN